MAGARCGGGGDRNGRAALDGDPEPLTPKPPTRGVRRPAPPARQAPPLELAPIRFADAPLAVRLIPGQEAKPETAPPRQRFYVWVGVAGGVFVMGILFLLILPSASPPEPLSGGGLPGVAVGFSAPQFVSVWDEGAMDVMVRNDGSAPITATVTLVFAGHPPLSAFPGESLSAAVEGLPGGSQAARRLRFLLNGWTERALLFQVVVELPDGRRGATAWQPLNVALIPRLTRLLNLLLTVFTGSTILAGLGNLFSDRLKRLLFPD